jgi:hypothetical protein
MDGVVGLPPTLDQLLGLQQRDEHLTCQELVHVHDEHDAIQTSPDELPEINIHSL